MPFNGAYLICRSATGSPPTSCSFSMVRSAPIKRKILTTPMRVGFIPTCSITRSEAGQIAAATKKKVAEEISEGTSISVAISSPSPKILQVSAVRSTL